MDKLKTNIHLSIMPTYKCNYHCKYCYLGDMTKDNTILDLNIVSNKIQEIDKRYNIDNVCIYGGEVSLLDKKYLLDLTKILNKYNISLVTNLSNDWVVDFCLINDIRLCVSLNEERPFYNETLTKLRKLKHIKNISLSIVILPSLITDEQIEKAFDIYEELGFEVLFIPYHPSITSKEVVDIKSHIFEESLMKFLKENNKRNNPITISNEIILKDVNYEPTSNKFLFINPNGDYSSVKYDDKGIESFITFNSLDEYDEFCNNEKTLYYNKCHDCKFYGKCKAEHLIFNGYEKSCSGLYHCLDQYCVDK